MVLQQELSLVLQQELSSVLQHQLTLALQFSSTAVFRPLFSSTGTSYRLQDASRSLLILCGEKLEFALLVSIENLLYERSRLARLRSF